MDRALKLGEVGLGFFDIDNHIRSIVVVVNVTGAPDVVAWTMHITVAPAVVITTVAHDGTVWSYCSMVCDVMAMHWAVMGHSGS
jgi:hypothetical protein